MCPPGRDHARTAGHAGGRIRTASRVLAFGFSLGSGVKGDGVINAIDFNSTRYTFAADVTLSSKDQCKNGAATSTAPTYKNQGDCVSSFAKNK
jgi:hypothetical protein